jgi:hypothetical protein
MRLADSRALEGDGPSLHPRWQRATHVARWRFLVGRADVCRLLIKQFDGARAPPPRALMKRKK